MRLPFVLLFAVLCSLLACEKSCAAPRPNVVFLMLDTTRADHLGPFNPDSPAATPFLDQLAEHCVVFENAWTAATCTAPSIASMFTGLYPPRHGLESNILAMAGPKDEGLSVREFLTSVDLIALPGSVPTLTEHLRGAGYQTVGIGANPNFCKALGFSRGFDFFEESSERDASQMATVLRDLRPRLDSNKPTFTYMHFMDAHAPYRRRAPWCPHTSKASCPDTCRYQSEVSYLDSELKQLFDEAGWLEDDNTILVLVTDHGEEFREHGDIMHRFSVHTELARAGLMILAPGLAVRRSAMPAHHTDLLPTLLALLDLPPPALMDGIALIPALDRRAMEPRELLTCRKDRAVDRDLWALTRGDWRLLEQTPKRSFNLYNIAEDPHERTNLVKTHPQVFKDMRQRLRRLRERIVPVPAEHVQVDLTERLNRELSHLGYVQGE